MPPSPTAAAKAADSAARVPAALAFVAGFVDVQCFLGLAQTFAAFMTGTLIALGAELADPTPDRRTKLAMIATFVPAVALTTLALRALNRRFAEAAVVRRFVLAEAVLLAGMMLLGGLLEPLPPGGSWQMIVVGMVAVAAMSVQNVLMVHLLAFHPATTVMTLNMIHFIGHALGAVTLTVQPGEAPKTNASEARRYAWAFVPYLGGVATGGLGYRWLGFWSIGAPVVVLLLLAAWLTRRDEGMATPGRDSERHLREPSR